MFEMILQNILNRYSKEELIKRYDISLPSDTLNKEVLKNFNLDREKVKGVFQSYSNIKKSNNFIMGAKNDVFPISEESGIVVKTKETFLGKIIRKFSEWKDSKLKAFKDSIRKKIREDPKKQKIMNIMLNIVSALFTIISILVGFLQMLRSSISAGNPVNIIISLFVAFIALLVKGIFIIISLFLSPIIDKLVDKRMEKDYVKRMIKGYFLLNEIYLTDSGVIVLNKEELSKAEIVKEKKDVLIKLFQGEEKITFMDNIKSKFIPYYFVNTQTILKISEKDFSKFDFIK